ncbi:uncharacterized protein VICG_01020 [Vittaforma corneae ATCC 50505]|uniref:Cyclin N-terminal domain-containing protein n=1 Tax=Vittaforma corneae (strain ATCC 50505) TaxID=993615 RepID=L2GM81_VITCO|nr:uncharacterized protein VICG_01020 [Vittaforma corneae ATCC 50505]ELA42003.1 hypothetical protein VICG_01020 [Vittaforma corneae ATCC 50505]
MLTQNLILNWTTRMNFPLKVRSTSLQLNCRLQEYFKNNEFVNALSLFDACCFKSQTCIFLACKFEDIHGYLNRIIHKVGEFSNRFYLDRILEFEAEILEFLKFDFNCVNLYQSALAVKFLVEKQNPNTGIQWEYILLRLNKIFCIVDLTQYLMEAVLAAFEQDSIICLGLKYNKKIMAEIKAKSKNVDFILDQEIQERCEKAVQN